MAKHMVTFLIGVIVDAEDKDAAITKAALPLKHGVLPNLVGYVSNGARLAQPGDEEGEIQRRIEALARS